MDNIFISSLLWPAIYATLASFVVTGLVVKFGKRLKIIDDPKLHRHPKVVHTAAVPRGGGLPVFAALALGTIIFLPSGNTRVLAVLLGAFLLSVVGFLDDRFEERVSPYFRLAINVLAALVVIASGIAIPYITNPLGGIIPLDQPQLCFGTHCIWLLADLFALVWLVGMQNIVGWSSGVDGQMPGFVVIAAVTMGLMSLKFGTDLNQIPALILAGLTAGAYLGFLPWNWYPQKIIPGYGGKSLAGFLLGILAIVSGAKVGAMILVLGIPIIDAALVIIKRLRQGKSPVWGGRDHLHHSLLDLGWGKRRIAVFYWAISGALAFFALNLNSRSKYFTMAVILLVFGGIILWLQNWSTMQKQPDRDSG